MKRVVVLLGVAEKEFDDSITWYKREREGLGPEFRATVEEYFQRIADNSEWFPKVRGEVRSAVVRRFPFVMHVRLFCDPCAFSRLLLLVLGPNTCENATRARHETLSRN